MSNSPANLDDVQRRRAEIKVEHAALRDKIRALEIEDAELDIAERVLRRLSGVPEPQLGFPFQGESLGNWLSPSGWRPPSRPLPSGRTVEDAIIWVLEGAVDPWATSNQIQAAISAVLSRPVPMNTVSPMLTAMKIRGVIARDGLKVALARRVPDKAAAG